MVVSGVRHCGSGSNSPRLVQWTNQCGACVGWSDLETEIDYNFSREHSRPISPAFAISDTSTGIDLYQLMMLLLL